MIKSITQLKAVSALFLTIFSVPALASDRAGTISLVHSMPDGVILFYLSGSRAPAPPSCNVVDRWAFNATTAAGQARLALLLTAYASGKVIAVHGTGTCPDRADTETVDFFYAA